MYISSETVREIDYIIRRFDEFFHSYKDRQIGLYPGVYLNEIVSRFDDGYRFHVVEAREDGELPEDIDVLILTDIRRDKEEDYLQVHESCEKQDILLLDLFGQDLIRLHQELQEHAYLTIPEWKELLNGYDVISMPVIGAVANYKKKQDRYIIQHRFLILFEWLLQQGKTVVLFYDDDRQKELLEKEGFSKKAVLFERTQEDPGFMKLLKNYRSKKMIHLGRSVSRDGIVPREYGLDSRIIRYFQFSYVVIDSPRKEFEMIDREELKEAIRSHDVISFDIFDTLIKRIVLYPKDVFEMVEEKTGIRGFADCRYEIQTTIPQLDLAGIYRHLQKKCGYDDSTVRKLIQTELQIESDVITARSSMVELFDYAKALHKTIVLVSDMYLDQDFIRQLLSRSGITGYQELYLSYQYGKLKHEGLYEELTRNRKETILHIGDNHFADIRCARKFGLDAYYVPSSLELAKKNGYREIIEKAHSLAERKLLGLSIAAAFDDPFARHDDILIADMVIAPLAMSYLEWVCKDMKDRHFDRFLLSSRDGAILLDAYGKLQKRDPEHLPVATYFYTNRRAAFLTVMDDLETVKYFIYLSDYKDDPSRMLKRLCCLPEEKLLPYQGETVEEYYSLHANLIHEEAEKYRHFYKEYLDAEGITGKKCAIMDFVSQGSSQIMLEKHLCEKMHGYYIGIPEYVTRFEDNISYYFDHDLMDYDTEMKTEVYFTSMEASLDHIGEQGRPVFAKENRSPKTLERIAFIQEHIRSYLDRYIDILFSWEDKIDKELVFELCRTVNFYAAKNHYYDDMSGQMIKEEYQEK